MNKETIDLIKQLADKLGTTAKHLWGVLIKQAPISATLDAIFVSLIIIVSVIFEYFLIKYIVKSVKEYNGFDNDSLGALFGCGVIAIGVFLVCGIELPRILAGFLNPEYWALKEILGTVK